MVLVKCTCHSCDMQCNHRAALRFIHVSACIWGGSGGCRRKGRRRGGGATRFARPLWVRYNYVVLNNSTRFCN